MVGTIILVAIVLVLLSWAVGAYKRLVSLHKQFRNAYAQLVAQLQLRDDLIPNLVETAKGCMAHEREALEALIAARNQAVAANAKAAVDPSDVAAVRQAAATESALTSSLGNMLALSEAYPDLESNQDMLRLTEELAGMENRIAFARQVYNGGVMQYNTSLEQFPGSIIATMFAFRPAELLQSAEAPQERKAVKVPD
jgi:LemA protein